ncbi:MAG TPA: YifB family Mg chelatase-like AAA ATPase [Candidatus Acidoferrum sp.]|nr:YifB family Mg chelatase-like AAA ATPase [Candidatus Acidoferrum sp.]
MLFKTLSASVYGIDAYLVEVEVDVGSARMNDFNVVGLPDNAVKESRERIKAALRNCGYEFPYGQGVTINLAPADIRKEGSGFDLPMALGLVGCQGQFFGKQLDKCMFLGELSLDGSVRSVRGALSAALAARECGMKSVGVPEVNAKEAAVVEGVEVFALKSLPQAVDLVNSPESFAPVTVDAKQMLSEAAQYSVDLRDVHGQQAAKRALEVACAGGHNILFIGPPGAGKTMLAKRIPTILPPMSLEEAIETTRIHSVAGVLEDSRGLVGTRPYRSPHHTISDAGLIGGGAVPRPGEVSLGHNGVLFLDELPEFQRNVLEVMRQPLEDGAVTISRAAVSVTFPSRFMLAAAMNPCPCGYFGDPTRECHCTPPMIQRYVSKISGPLLDRIDIHIEVPAVKYKELRAPSSSEDSASVRQRVIAARDRQVERFRGEKKTYANAQMMSKMIRKHCTISAEGEKLLENAITRLGLSARAHDRILKVARTIADLDGAAGIEPKHLSEAIQYRTLDRTYWA